MRVYKSKRVPPFTFFGTVRHFPKEICFSKISSFFSKKNVLRFLSLRYSADLRRSRLVYLERCQDLGILTVFFDFHRSGLQRAVIKKRGSKAFAENSSFLKKLYSAVWFPVV